MQFLFKMICQILNIHDFMRTQLTYNRQTHFYMPTHQQAMPVEWRIGTCRSPQPSSSMVPSDDTWRPCRVVVTRSQSGTASRQRRVKVTVPRGTEHIQYIDLSHSCQRPIKDTVKSFLFIGHLILCISCVGQSTNLTSHQNITLVTLCIILYPRIPVCMSMSIIIKPRNCVPMKFNYFTV